MVRVRHARVQRDADLRDVRQLAGAERWDELDRRRAAAVEVAEAEAGGRHGVVDERRRRADALPPTQLAARDVVRDVLAKRGVDRTVPVQVLLEAELGGRRG